MDFLLRLLLIFEDLFVTCEEFCNEQKFTLFILLSLSRDFQFFNPLPPPQNLGKRSVCLSFIKEIRRKHKCEILLGFIPISLR
jgi:hypothetical protein